MFESSPRLDLSTVLRSVWGWVLLGLVVGPFFWACVGPFLWLAWCGNWPFVLVVGFAIPSWGGRLALLGVGVGTYFPVGLGEVITVVLPLPSWSELGFESIQ